MIQEITDQNYQEIIKKNQIVIIEFRAERCNPCKVLGPIYESISKIYEGKILFGKVNIDENPAISIMYRITGIPTILTFLEGKYFGDAIVGVKSLEDYKNIFDKLIQKSDSLKQISEINGIQQDLTSNNTTMENTNTPKIIEVKGTAQFKEIISSEKNIILVDFRAERCGPCRILKPTLHEIVEKESNITLLTVDVDDEINQELAGQFQVSSIPYVVIFKDGQAKDAFIGARDQEEVLEKINAIK